jgi:hypothetical protein
MSKQQRTIDYLLEQSTGVGAVSIRPMFGEYGVYVGAGLSGDRTSFRYGCGLDTGAHRI